MNKNIILIIIALIIIVVLSVVPNSEPYDNLAVPNLAVPVLALYYTEWCHYSKIFMNEWEKIRLSPVFINTKLVKYDCDKSGECENISGYPTIILHINGSSILFPATLDRTADNVIAFFKNYI